MAWFWFAAVVWVLGGALIPAVAAEPLELPVPGVAEALEVALPATWCRVKLVKVDGAKRHGYLRVDGDDLRFRSGSRGEGDPITADEIASIEYRTEYDRQERAARRRVEDGAYSEVITALSAAPDKLRNDPALALVLREAQMAQAAIDGLRGRLVASKENAARPGYIDDLAAYIETCDPDELEEPLRSGLARAWHVQVADLDPAARKRWQDVADQVDVDLAYDPKGPEYLAAARKALAADDTAAAVREFERAWSAHATFTTDDHVALARAYLATGKKNEAGRFLRRLPRRVRLQPEIDTMLDAAGVNKNFDVFAFRGDYTGRFITAAPPTAWSASGANRLWTLPLKDGSNASPVINGNKVFVCAEPNSLVCVDKRSGRELWRSTNSLADAGSGGEPHSPNWIGTYGWTCMTPVTTGDRVWFAGGNGVVACYDLVGNRRWITTVEVGGRFHGSAASPCLAGRYLVTYTASGSGGRYHGFDAETGQQLYSFKGAITQGGLVPFLRDGTPYIISSGGLVFDAATGTILWDKEQLFGRKGSSDYRGHNWGATVVLHEDVAYFSNHYNKGDGSTPITHGTENTLMLAVDLSGSQPRELWWQPTGGRIGASHIVHDGLVYVAGGRCFEADTGKVVYDNDGPKASYSSLVLGGDLIYCFGKKNLTIYRTGRSYTEVASFDHGFRDFIASAVFDGRVMYFRDSNGLHCIANDS